RRISSPQSVPATMSLVTKLACRKFRHSLAILGVCGSLSLLGGLPASAPALAGDESPTAAPATPPAAATPAAETKPRGFQVEGPPESPAAETNPGGLQVEVPQPPTPKNPVPIGYIRQFGDHPRPASRVDAEPSNAGVAGAKLANDENNAGGQCTGEVYSLDVATVGSTDQAVAEAQKLFDSGHHFMLVDAPAETLLKLSDW